MRECCEARGLRIASFGEIKSEEFALYFLGEARVRGRRGWDGPKVRGLYNGKSEGFVQYLVLVCWDTRASQVTAFVGGTMRCCLRTQVRRQQNASETLVLRTAPAWR